MLIDTAYKSQLIMLVKLTKTQWALAFWFSLLYNQFMAYVRIIMGFSENRDTNKFASVNFFAGEAESRSNTVFDNEAYGKIDSKMFVKEVFRGSLILFPLKTSATGSIREALIKSSACIAQSDCIK